MEEKSDVESSGFAKDSDAPVLFSNRNGNESSFEDGKGRSSEAALNVNLEAASVSLKHTPLDFTYMSSIFNETLCTIISPTLSDLQRHADSDQWSIIESWRTVDESEDPVTHLAIDNTVPPTVRCSLPESMRNQLSAASVYTQCNTLYFDSPDDHFTVYERILFGQQKQQIALDGLGDVERMNAETKFQSCYLQIPNQENGINETLKMLQNFYLNAAKVASQWQNEHFQIPPVWHREMLVYMGGQASKMDKKGKGSGKDKKKQEKADKKERKRREKESKKEEKKTKKSSKKVAENASKLSRMASKTSTDASSVRSKSAMLSDSSEGGSSASQSSSDYRSKEKSRGTRRNDKSKKSRKSDSKVSKKKDSKLSAKNGSKFSSTDEGEDDASSATGRSDDLDAKGMSSTQSGKKSPESKVKVVKNDDERAQVFGSADESSAEETKGTRGEPVSLKPSRDGKFSKGSKDSKRSTSQSKTSKQTTKDGTLGKRTKEDSKDIKESEDEGEESLRSEDEGRDTQRSIEQGKSKLSKSSKGGKKRSKKDSKKDSRLLETLIEDRDGTTPQGAQSTTVEGEINFDKSGEGDDLSGEDGSKDGLSAADSPSKEPLSGRGSGSKKLSGVGDSARKSDSNNMSGRSGSRDSRGVSGRGSRDRSRASRGSQGRGSDSQRMSGSQGRGSDSQRMSGSQGRGSDSQRMSGSQGRGSDSPRKIDSMNTGSRDSQGVSRDLSSDSRGFSGGGSEDPGSKSPRRSDTRDTAGTRGSRGQSGNGSRNLSGGGSEINRYSNGRDSSAKTTGGSRDNSRGMSGNRSTAKDGEAELKTYETSDYIIQCPCKRHCAETATEFTNKDAGVPTEPVMPQIIMVDALSSRLPVDKPEKHPEMHLAPRRYECVCPGPCMCPKPAFIPSKSRILSLADCCKICVVCAADCPIKSSFTAVFCSECNGNLCGNCAVNHHFNLPEHFIHDIYGNAIVFCKIHPPDDMSKGPLVQKRHCQKCHSILHKCRMHLQCNKNAIPKVKRYGRILPKRGQCYNNPKKCCGLESRMETCTCSKSCVGKSGKDPTCKVHGKVVVKDPTFYSFSECYVLCVVCGTEVSKSPFSCVFCDQCKGNICSVCVAFHYGYLDHTLRNSVGDSIHLCAFHSRQMPKKSWEKSRDPTQPDYNCVVCHAMSLASMAPITRTQFEPLKKFMKTKSAKVRGRRASVARRTLNEQLMGPIPSRRGQRGATKVDWNNRGATLRMLSARGIVSKEISAAQIIQAAEKIGINKERLMRMIAKNKIKICAKEKCAQHLRHPYFEKVRGPRSTYARRIRRLNEVNVAKRRDKDDRPLLSPNWLSKMIAESKHKKIYNPNAGWKDDETLDLIEAERKMSKMIDRFEMRAANEYPYEWITDPIKNYHGIPNPRLHTNCGSTWSSSMPFEQERYFWKIRGDT